MSDKWVGRAMRSGARLSLGTHLAALASLSLTRKSPTDDIHFVSSMIHLGLMITAPRETGGASVPEAVDLHFHFRTRYKCASGQ